MKHTLRRFTYLLFLALCLSVPAQAQEGHKPAAEPKKPEAYVLSAASPNPFNPTTTFRLSVTQRQEVRVDIYNMLGQPVKRLFQGVMDNNETRTFTFDAGELPTGIYIYRVQGERFATARQVTLLK